MTCNIKLIEFLNEFNENDYQLQAPVLGRELDRWAKWVKSE